jgi:hypothetical protein
VGLLLFLLFVLRLPGIIIIMPSFGAPPHAHFEGMQLSRCFFRRQGTGQRSDKRDSLAHHAFAFDFQSGSLEIHAQDALREK